MISVVRFILTKDELKAFNKWLKVTRERLDLIAPLPAMKQRQNTEFESKEAFWVYKQPRRGLPLPPMILDPKTDLSGIDLHTEATSFVGSQNYKENRYLASPSAMRKTGFEGTPYAKAKVRTLK
jgi:hypothetical protein